MIRSALIIVYVLVSAITFAQSKTTQALSDKYKNSLSLFFYNNTLRMLNQTEDKDFDELIKDIEKMKFLMIDKDETGFKKEQWTKLVKDYKSESYEEIMTTRHQGKNFDVYLKEKDGVTKGMVVLVNDSSSLYVLDILGRIALDKVGNLYKAIDQSTDVGNKIKAFTDRNEKRRRSDDDNDN